MELVLSTLRSICSAILFPPSVFILLMLLFVFYNRNKKIALMQKMIVGGSVDSPIELTLSQFVLGVFGGIIGSIILNSFGVVFNENCRIEVLFLTSILLMFIKPRFVCFSYSASLLGAISIILNVVTSLIPEFNYTSIFKVDILYIMVFVGVMHVVEGILVFIDGHRGAIPIFIKKDNKILGGYSLKRYWVIPMAIMIMGNMINFYGNYNGISLHEIPNYWIKFKSTEQINMLKTVFIYILSFYAVVGYSSITYTRTKKEKALSSGIHIFSYGVLLIIVSQVARIGILGEILVVVFTPITHEFMLSIQRKEEKARSPKFISDESGLVVLEISNDSKLKEFNIDINSRIISVDDKFVESEKDIYSIFKKNFFRAVIEIKDLNGIIKKVEYKHDNSRLGVSIVPRYSDEKDDSKLQSKKFKDILEDVNNKNT